MTYSRAWFTVIDVNVRCSVVDPDSLCPDPDTDPDPAFKVNPDLDTDSVPNPDPEF
jgi:hypothetical protein